MHNGQTFKMTLDHLVRYDNQIQQFPYHGPTQATSNEKIQ